MFSLFSFLPFRSFWSSKTAEAGAVQAEQVAMAVKEMVVTTVKAVRQTFEAIEDFHAGYQPTVRRGLEGLLGVGQRRPIKQ
ncbi:hypothetical protein [Actinoallomurus sp. NPDC050550]|uniref:hypothetical protein n=1 Tax=Actinoallomurus sp. NPDC050550 TaxID=3154937 RepID=UPI0033DEA8E9